MSSFVPEPPTDEKGRGSPVIVWIMRWFLIIAMAGGIWLAGEVFHTIKDNHIEVKTQLNNLSFETKNEIKGLATAIVELEKHAIRIDSSGFTNKDWVEAKNNIDKAFQAHETRLTNNEALTLSIKESLYRLETAIGTKPKT